MSPSRSQEAAGQGTMAETYFIAAVGSVGKGCPFWDEKRGKFCFPDSPRELTSLLLILVPRRHVLRSDGF